MRPLALLILVSLAASASPQTVADALRMSAKPITAADLPDGYRAVALGGDNGIAGFSSLMMMGMSSGSDRDPQARVFFNLMGASFVDPDEFAALLDGKRPRIRAYSVDAGAMVGASGSGSKMPAPLFTESWIEAGRVVQWSPRPALTKAAILEAFGRPEVPGGSTGEQTAGLSNVKQVALGVIIYSGDSDDVYPFANSTAEAQKVISPYLKNDSLWKSPNGGRILYNTALSGTSATALEAPAETLLVWEEKPYPDGKRAVGYADGHAMRRDEPEWAQIWAMELRRRQRAKMDATKMKRLISSQLKPKG